MIYRFAPFELDSLTRRLTRDTHAVGLRPRGLALLICLIERQGRNVTRPELASRLWPDVHVSESSFSTLIAETRRTLGDDGQRQQFIATVPRRGYRFAAPVVVESRSVSPGDTGRVAEGPRGLARPFFDPTAVAAAAESLDAALECGPRQLDIRGPAAPMFADHWAATARDRGLVVHRARRTDAAYPPLFGWWQLAESVLESAATEKRRDFWRGLRSEIETLAKSGTRDHGDVTARQRHFAVCDGLARGLVREAREGPCALFLEGLGAEDAETRRLLTFVLDHAEMSPLWIVTSPDFETHCDHAVQWPSRMQCDHIWVDWRARTGQH